MLEDKFIEYADQLIEFGIVMKLNVNANRDGDLEKVKQYSRELEKIKNKIDKIDKELKSINKKKVYRFNNVLEILN
ncbi:hypothetical protein [Clostridium sp. UBA5988]|uniref:hypothetical protein n=1 Tax=Clostridium sp. UBA5988 TaxID=1946369 RepID=UPI003217ABE5